MEDNKEKNLNEDLEQEDTTQKEPQTESQEEPQEEIQIEEEQQSDAAKMTNPIKRNLSLVRRITSFRIKSMNLKTE